MRNRALVAVGLASVVVLATAAAANTLVPPAAAGHAPGWGDLAARLLPGQNAERTRVGVPHLEWSGKLAGEAQNWADRLAQEGVMRHAPREHSGGAGESLWMGSAGFYTPEAMIESFVSERRLYRHGSFPRVSATGNWKDVGHYTQIVWRDTREVGCGVARGQRFDVLVCRYWPAGNGAGKIAF